MDKHYTVDFTKHEAFAKHIVKCDACQAKIGERYPSKPDSIAISLPKTKDAEANEYGYVPKQDMHFCNEDCLREHLNSRASKK